MSIYLDTSFLVPYYFNEASSERVEAVLTAVPVGALVVSAWTRLEFVSTVARLVRMDRLPGEANSLVDRLDEHLRSVFTPLEPEATDFRAAAEILLYDPRLGLRGPDALHLALAASRGLVLYTLDRALLGAAHALGLAASDAGIDL